jgi:ribosomal protein L1
MVAAWKGDTLKTSADFDSTIRRFDPSRPSQPFRRSAEIPKKREKEPKIAAFRESYFVSRLLIR